MSDRSVGEFNYCPHCGRPAMPPEYTSGPDVDPEESEDWEEWRCSCCDRPWIACPCTPRVVLISDECGAINE